MPNQPVKSSLSPKELAHAIGVSESSLRRWVDSGAIGTSRTLGGHRRIPLADALRFIRSSQSPLLRPELLGLPPVAVPAPDSDLAAESDAVYDALEQGDAARLRGQLLALFVANVSIAAICDGPLRRAMHRMGELWAHDPRGILTEHRATDLCLRAVNHLRELIDLPPADAPRAIGAAPGGDPYLLPSMMAATVLCDCGYLVTNFGPNTPVELLASAAEGLDAKLTWLSLSVPVDRKRLEPQVLDLAGTMQRRGGALVIGGREAATALPRRRAAASTPQSHVHLMGSMTELAALARGMR